MKRTELHRHLDVSLRSATIHEIAIERSLIAQSTSLTCFQEQLYIREPLESLTAVLATFSLFQKVLATPEILERVAFEALEDCYHEGTRRVEFRFSPSFCSEFSGLAWDEILSSFERGLQRGVRTYPDMQWGLICIATRDYGVDSVDESVEFFLRNRLRFVGCDLAGNENQFPCRLFEGSFRKARAQGAKITIHAGEAVGPENIWEAIELLGATRIGHGIAAIRDPKLLEHLRKHEICLEVCPTSNWLTKCVPSLEAHPLPALLRAGVPVCVNTDDPGIFGKTLLQEIEVCKTRLGMSEGEIEKCFEFAARASFLS
ncbi:adenosine deaminase [Bdellovibrionota bacterium FG-2]